jgi:hypothetical protein
MHFMSVTKVEEKNLNFVTETMWCPCEQTPSTCRKYNFADFLRPVSTILSTVNYR